MWLRDCTIVITVVLQDLPILWIIKLQLSYQLRRTLGHNQPNSPFIRSHSYTHTHDLSHLFLSHLRRRCLGVPSIPGMSITLLSRHPASLIRFPPILTHPCSCVIPGLQPTIPSLAPFLHITQLVSDHLLPYLRQRFPGRLGNYTQLSSFEDQRTGGVRFPFHPSS